MTTGRKVGAGKESVMSFEESMKRLEDIVTSLSEGELPLRQALTLYEEGMKLVKECRSALEDSKAKVEKLNRLTGELELFELKNE